MQNIMVGLIIAIILLLMLFPLWLLVKVSYNGREKVSEKEANNFVSVMKSKKIISAEKQDIRTLSYSEQKTKAPFIDDNNNFFKSPESKNLQDVAAELLVKVAENTRKNTTEQHQKEHLRQSLKVAKDVQNARQLQKISNRKTRKKVAKTVAKKNIELDNEKIKKIKIKAAAKSR